MKKVRHILAILLLFGVFSACQKPVATAPVPASPPAHQSPTKAQAKLPTMKLWLGPAEITAELASTSIQVETGMMHRTEMAENEGMLFIFGGPHQASFWMRNTVLPLSCAYI